MMSKYGLLLQNCSDLIIGLNKDGCVFEINAHAEKVFGIYKKNILNKNLFLFCQERNITFSLSEDYFKSTFRNSDNSLIVFITNKKTQHKYSFKCLLTSSVENKYILIGHKLNSVCEVQTCLKSVIESLPQYIYWKDKNFVYMGCNKHVSDYLSLKSPDEIVGKTDNDFGWSKERINFLKVSDSTVFNEGKEILVEDQIPLGGTMRTMLSSKSPLRNQKGETIGVLGVTVDITDRKQLEEELRIAKEQAETASKAKTEFIANMSHDIRTPLTGVIGLSAILEQTLQNKDDKENAHMLHDSGEELLHMLNEILDDIRADHLDKEDIIEESFDLHECINDLVHLESPATFLKNLILKTDIASNVPRYIKSDRNKIHRILLNLLGNAIKFTQSGSITISIECLHQDGVSAHLKFAVSDTGIGIPEEVQSQVFNRFFKVSSSYKGIYTGHGLGLHIAQSYVNLLGGHITLTSRVGEGSTFHFDLECPLSEAPVQEKEILPSPDPPSVEILQKNVRLLLVEDNSIALKTLEMMLAKKGYTFISATTGEEAWAMFRTHPIDLIITDIGLPGISGTELTQRIRNYEKDVNKPAIPIIGLTGHAKEAAWNECQQAGMNEVLTKPAQIQTLEEIILQFVNPSSCKVSNDSKKPEVSPLGIDLPQTEEALFQLDSFPVFDEKLALEQVPDKNLLITLLQTYISDEIQKDIHQMQIEYQQNNWEKVEKLAHKMKGGVTYLGTQKMRYAC